MLALLLVKPPTVRGVVEENNTFGYTTVGGDAASWTTGDVIVGCQFTAPSLGAGTTIIAESITVRLRELATGSVNFTCLIYEENATGSFNYVAITEERELSTPVSYEWFTFSFSSTPTLTKGDNYLLAVWGEDNFATRYDAGTTNQTYRDDESYSYASPPSVFSEDAGYDNKTSIYCTYTQTFQYTLKGLYDEVTGDRDGAVNVTAHYTESSPETFEVDGTYIYRTGYIPSYFSFDLTNDRQYWVSTNENASTIYIFEASTTTYTVQFVDVGGVLGSYSFISIRCSINGTVHTVEKRQADINNKISVNLIQDKMYTVYIEDDIVFEYGNELFGADTTPTIYIEGVNIPETIIMAYRQVQLYADRHSNFTGISMVYNDTEEDTDHVDCYINYRNGTNAYNTTVSANTFNATWSSAEYDTTYFVEMFAYHNNYGTIHYASTLWRGGMNQGGWGMDWIGTIPNIATSTLIPMFLIFLGAGAFSKINAYVGAFVAVGLACLFVFWGWITIAPAMLIMALVFTLLFALGSKKREEATI